MAGSPRPVPPLGVSWDPGLRGLSPVAGSPGCVVCAGTSYSFLPTAGLTLGSRRPATDFITI